MNKLYLVLLSTVLLAACGSDDDETPIAQEDGVGFFIDSPVQGLTYSSTSHQGITDAYGRFNYEAGEVITFSFGDIQLPAVTASKAIHISDLFANGMDDEQTINLARLMLALDSDADSDNGIQLSADAVLTDNTGPLASLTFTDAGFTALATEISTYLQTKGGSTTLISEADAREHIIDTKAEVEGLLVGCGNECVPRAAYNEFVESTFPRSQQVNVSTSTDIKITFTSEYSNPLTDTNVEMFAVPTGAYNNCRIDWPGFRCADLGVGSYELSNLSIVTSFTPSISGSTVTFDVPALLSGNTYIVHIFADGAQGDTDDYKTWWAFNTE